MFCICMYISKGWRLCRQPLNVLSSIAWDGMSVPRWFEKWFWLMSQLCACIDFVHGDRGCDTMQCPCWHDKRLLSWSRNIHKMSNLVCSSICVSIRVLRGVWLPQAALRVPFFKFSRFIWFHFLGATLHLQKYCYWRRGVPWCEKIAVLPYTRSEIWYSFFIPRAPTLQCCNKEYFGWTCSWSVLVNVSISILNTEVGGAGGV